MDIMDSTDTPIGGLDGTTASRGDLPLSVDQRDAFASPTNSSRQGGSQPTHSSSSFSSSSSAFDNLDYVNNTSPNAMPTSTDDVMMPTTEYASHPSLLSQETSTLLPHTSPSVKGSVNETATEAQAKASSLGDSARSSMSHLKDSVTNQLHNAEDKVEGAYHELKKDVSAHLPHTTPNVRSTARPEPTDTHPAAASMRDTHLHPGLVSLPTHSNESPPTSTPHISLAHQQALSAAASTEPKDASASTGLMGVISSLHSKLEEGAEVVKEKVDGWADAHLRSEQKPGEHLSEAHARDIPTLVVGDNDKNTENVRARMHSSGERSGAQASTEAVVDSI